MPAAWAGLAQWRILEVGFGSGEHFLAAWRDWKLDAQRPRILHFVAVVDQPPTPADPALARECYGLLPGVHRLLFEHGQVLLTLCIGDADRMVRQLDFHADAVILAAGVTLKTLARRCRRGTTIAARDADGELAGQLKRHGFAVSAVQDSLQGEFAPAWEPRGPAPKQPVVPGDCVVIGAGLAGAAAAASLARRGWRVRVLDAGPAAASGASALPAGLLVPQSSPDDNLLSRLSRDGVRATLQQAQMLLQSPQDWEPSGVLEHHIDGGPASAQPLQPAAAVWSRPADGQHKRLAGLDDAASADWHEKAAWIRPAQLVNAWLAQPGVTLQSDARVAAIDRVGETWQLRDDSGQLLASAALVIVAAAYATQDLLPGIALQPVRGQVSWALHDGQLELPPFPVNGDGSFIPSVPSAEGPAWICGASFDRSDLDVSARAADRQGNLERLRRLLPGTARQLESVFASERLRSWTGIRCASTDRRPLVGPVDPDDPHSVWVSTAMGSRGLTFAALCGELIAARLHGEPLPLARNLALALSVDRQNPVFRGKKR